MRETRAQLQERIERLEDRLYDTEAELGSLDSLSDVLREENWDLREQLDARTDEINTLRSDLSSANAARTEAERRIGRLAIEAGEAEHRCDIYLRVIDNQLAQIHRLENSL